MEDVHDIGGPAAGRPDIDADVSRIWETLSGGGTAIFRSNVGYGIFGATKGAIERINLAKGRAAHKRVGISMNHRLSEEIHLIEPDKREIISLITKDYDLPLGVVAPFREEHPYVRAIDPEVKDLCTAKGTLATGLNSGGPFHSKLQDLAYAQSRPFFGSSANLTGGGQRYSIEAIEPEIMVAADLVFDYGPPCWRFYNAALTMIDFRTMDVLRFGACYDLIADAVERHFGLKLPADPGRGVNPSGHREGYALAAQA